MEIKSTNLLFLYRSILFKKVSFTTDKKELKTIVNALNIKKKKERNKYVYEEAIRVINKYYQKDLCKFIDGRCIAQRKNPTNTRVNGCCFRCPIVTDKGCPSENIACKLIYCKTSLRNFKLLKFNNIKILKCLPITKRLIILGDFFITKKEVLDDINHSIIVWLWRVFIRKIKTL